MLRFNGKIKDCLGDMQKQYPEIKAVVMGTRRSDPYSCEYISQQWVERYK